MLQQAKFLIFIYEQETIRDGISGFILFVKFRHVNQMQ